MGFLQGLANVGAGIVDAGLDFVKSKYESDQQSRLNREQFAMQRDENLQSFLRNRDFEIERFGMQTDYDTQVWNRQQAYYDTAWEREKAYNLDLWNKQNEYNTPAAQMARMREAGLNPNLFYGQGTSGNAGVVHSSDLGKSELGRSEVGDASYEPARVNPGRYRIGRGSAFRGLVEYMGIRNAELQNRNLAAQNAVIQANAEYIRQNVRNLKRENEQMEDYSRQDPWIYRIGGKLIKWLRGLNWSSANDDVERGKLTLPVNDGVSNPPIIIPWPAEKKGR